MSTHACIAIVVISYLPENAGSRCRLLGQVLGLAELSSDWSLGAVACGPSGRLSCFLVIVASAVGS